MCTDDFGSCSAILFCRCMDTMDRFCCTVTSFPSLLSPHFLFPLHPYIPSLPSTPCRWPKSGAQCQSQHRHVQCSLQCPLWYRGEGPVGHCCPPVDREARLPHELSCTSCQEPDGCVKWCVCVCVCVHMHAYDLCPAWVWLLSCAQHLYKSP